MIDQEFLDQVNHIKRSLKQTAGFLGVYRTTLENPDGSKEVKYWHNVVTDVGLTMICNNLVDPTPDHDMLVNYVALGSSATAVGITDTQLTTETYRNAVASHTNGNKTAYITGYFTQTEVTGTFREAGIFADATGTANSGVLVSHVNINVTKTNVQKLTIDWLLTLASV